ncbi:hypothetical protein JCM10213_007954 [Rhodosporidiobolus nylandii]
MLTFLRPSTRTLPRLTAVRFSSSSSSIPSRIYPSLYYHPSPTVPTGTFSLSYLPTPPPSLSFSPTTIGLVRPLPSSGPSPALYGDERQEHKEEDERVPPITPRNFQENKRWMEMVHGVLRENVAQDAWMKTAAKAMEGSDTFIHIPDHRSPADANRQPNPQDIVASVLARDGEIVPESYEANTTSYRLVTSDGLQRLPEGLHEKLVEACYRVREVEEEVAAEREKEGEGERGE